MYQHQPKDFLDLDSEDGDDGDDNDDDIDDDDGDDDDGDNSIQRRISVAQLAHKPLAPSWGRAGKIINIILTFIIIAMYKNENCPNYIHCLIRNLWG